MRTSKDQGLVVISLLLLLQIGCSKNMQDRYRIHAPRATKDLGLIVEGLEPKNIDILLAEHAEAKVRVLNTQHGMFEIFGVTADDVKALAPSASVSPNRLVRMQASHGPPEGTQFGSLNRCKTQGNLPTAKITSTPAMPLRGAVLPLGVKIRIDSSKSQPSIDFPSPLNTAFLLETPKSSQIKSGPHDGAQLEFKPDALGAYGIIMMVQDKQDNCAYEALRFVITDNPEFKGSAIAPVHFDLAQFAHLKTVHAEESWRIGRGRGMVIASVDSGVDYNHPTLASQIAINEKEIPDNQIDDDKNGFVDDVIGYDLANSDNAPFDDDGHGTHTAALAAGRDFGMAKDAKILPVKVGTDGMSDVGTMASGVYYAVDRGAQIINMSNGATGPGTEPLEKAVNYAEKHGAIIVAAAGNGDFNSGLGIDDDRAGIVPASLPNDNIITVGASDPFNSLAPYSNYGAHTVDIVAPGGAEPGNLILSAATRNPKGDWLVGMAGTSMATPIVAGIVAQVWGLNPSLAPAEVKRIILNSGVVDERLKSVTVSGRQINALTAVTYARDHVSF